MNQQNNVPQVELKQPVLTKISRKLLEEINLKTERAIVLFQYIVKYQNKEINERHLGFYRNETNPVRDEWIPVSKKELNIIAKKRLFRTIQDIKETCMEITLKSNDAYCARFATSEKTGEHFVNTSKTFRKLASDFTKGYVGYEKDKSKATNRTERLIESFAERADFYTIYAEQFEYFTQRSRKDKQVDNIVNACTKLGYIIERKYAITPKGRVLKALVIRKKQENRKPSTKNVKKKDNRNNKSTFIPVRTNNYSTKVASMNEQETRIANLLNESCSNLLDNSKRNLLSSLK